MDERQEKEEQVKKSKEQEAVSIIGQPDLQGASHTETTGEHTGEGDRCDTEEMERVAGS